MKDFKEKVFEAVAMIPEGMVATYAQVAELAGRPGAARAVGNAIHTNTDPARTPCHRVVHPDGTLGSGYALGGPSAQRQRLLDEGVRFIDSGMESPRVDMARCGIVMENHPLEPFLPENARILFLGSFPPPKARWSMDFFYPNPQNDFWRIQGLIHFNDKDYFLAASGKGFDYEAVTAFCAGKGLAFFDTATRVCRLKANASDDFLHIITPTDVPGLLSCLPQCHTVVTTGGKSSDELLSILTAATGSTITPPTIGSSTSLRIPSIQRDIRWWRMPSTSRAYPMPLAAKASLYELFK